MNKTLDILQEMLHKGLISPEEYEMERSHYFHLVTAVHEFNERIIEKKIQLETAEKAEKIVSDPRVEKLFALVEYGVLSVEEFKEKYDRIKGTVK